jgi:hypothetical protein
VRFIGFFQSDDPAFEPADDIEERAAAIPRAILVLRKLANSAPPMALPRIRGRFPERSAAMNRVRVARA